MDDTSLHYYTTNLASIPENLGEFLDIGSSYSKITSLGVNSPYASTKRDKRKWGVLDGSDNFKDGSSLVLGLGVCTSSRGTIFPEKETEDESSVSPRLSINLHLGVASKGPEAPKPKLDLELSLSTGPAESDITTVTEGSSLCKNKNDAPALTSVQTVDEGSISSRWKSTLLVPPFLTTGIPSPFVRAHSHILSTSVMPNICLSPAIAQESSVCVSGETDQEQWRRNTSVKTCQYEGCTKGARGASGLCIGHGGGRRCQRSGCQKGAEGRTVFCKAHGGGRRCQHLGCTKSAEGRTDYCIGHGGGRRCSREGCPRAARGRSGLCIRHGGGKRCKVDNCSKSAEGVSGLCISHGGGRRCQYPACTKGAQGSTMFCKAHGGGKRCTFIGCTKGAEGSTSFCKGHGGGKRCTFEGCPKSVHGGTLFCVGHGGGKRCAMPGCTKSARGRTKFCVRHGGGKRCKFEWCTKSAQGSTDFCKAHGGGRRCSWGQLGSEFVGQAARPCDKFARGKSGLCAAHSSQVMDKQMHSAGSTDPMAHEIQPSKCGRMKDVTPGNNLDGIVTAMPNVFAGTACLSQFSLPEGRVHGGSLMSLLKGSTGFGQSNINHLVGGLSEPGKSHSMPHSWV